MPPDGLTGGDRLDAYLRSIGERLGGNLELHVGFLEGASYPNGTPVAAIAAINEWGARIEREPSETTIYRSVNAKGTGFLRNGRFVKAARSNFASTHYVGAHVINIPPRPFFRTMIANNAADWGPEFAVLVREKDYDADTALRIMGERIQAELQQSIIGWTTPANAPSTVAKKGFDHPLIDKGVMLRSAGYEVSDQ